MTAAAAIAARGTVLVVEDDLDVQGTLCEMLQDEGYYVEKADDGEEAWASLSKKAKPDLILLDLKLPRLNGYQLLERLRSNETLARIPVVVVSAFLGFPPVGARGWLRKPVDLKQLISTVARLTETPPAARDQDSR